jgi:hypothetical protein
MESAFGDPSLREIVGELQARHETAAAPASSRPQPAQQPDARAPEELPRVGAKPAGEIVRWRPDLGAAHHPIRSETCSLNRFGARAVPPWHHGRRNRQEWVPRARAAGSGGMILPWRTIP